MCDVHYSVNKTLFKLNSTYKVHTQHTNRINFYKTSNLTLYINKYIALRKYELVFFG